VISRFLIAAKIGFIEIFNNKLRSFLSIFAISIGVFTFLFVFSVINYSKEVIARAQKLAGENSITFQFNGVWWSKLKLDMKSFDEIMQKFPQIKILSPISNSVESNLRLDNITYGAIVLGITPNWKHYNWVYGKVKGRFINWDDISQHRKVAVFIRDPRSNEDKINYSSTNIYGRGRDNARKFKWNANNKSMLGRKFSFMRNTFTVVGEITAPLYQNDDRLVSNSYDFLIPITALSDIAFTSRFFDEIYIDAQTAEDAKVLRQNLINYFRIKEGNRNAEYSMQTFKEAAENKFASMRKNLLIVSILGIIAMISGGIGIMNVVLATIFARTKEIGTRRALGASKGDIFMQFSFESMTLGLFGALAGYVISLFAMDYISDLLSMTTKMDLFSVLAAFSIAVITGFIFSLYPSLKAANMNPVDALKVE
jgi:putative ABC transport system permease protein